MTQTLDKAQVVYSLGHNMPGYLPDDGTGSVTRTFAEAKERMIDDLLFFAQYAATEDDAEEFTAVAEDLNLVNGPSWGADIGIETFWIEPVWVDDAEEMMNDYEG